MDGELAAARTRPQLTESAPGKLECPPRTMPPPRSTHSPRQDAPRPAQQPRKRLSDDTAFAPLSQVARRRGAGRGPQPRMISLSCAPCRIIGERRVRCKCVSRMLPLATGCDGLRRQQLLLIDQVEEAVA